MDVARESNYYDENGNIRKHGGSFTSMSAPQFSVTVGAVRQHWV